MIYFDQSATSFPKPKGMIEEMENCMRYYNGNPGRSGHAMSLKMGEKIYAARKSISSLLGIGDPSRLIFTKNTTESLNLAIQGFLQPGDHVVTTSMEHNSVLRPLKALESVGVSHTIVKADAAGRVAVSAVESSICDTTKLIVMTAASNVTGTLMPIADVCRMASLRGISTLVDGAQWVGSLPLNVDKTGISMLAFPGHKGLLGPSGTGGLYVSPEIDLLPMLYGGTGTASKELVQPSDYPEGYEAGSLNGPGIIGLGYSANVLSRIGIETIAYYERQLITDLEEALRNMDFVTVYGPAAEEKTGISLFNVKGFSAEEVTERLSREFHIAVRGGFHCAGLAHKTIGTWNEGAIRLSVGPFNTRKEVRKTVDSLYRIGKSC